MLESKLSRLLLILGATIGIAGVGVWAIDGRFFNVPDWIIQVGSCWVARRRRPVGASRKAERAGGEEPRGVGRGNGGTVPRWAPPTCCTARRQDRISSRDARVRSLQAATPGEHHPAVCSGCYPRAEHEPVERVLGVSVRPLDHLDPAECPDGGSQRNITGPVRVVIES